MKLRTDVYRRKIQYEGKSSRMNWGSSDVRAHSHSIVPFQSKTGTLYTCIEYVHQATERMIMPDIDFVVHSTKSFGAQFSGFPETEDVQVKFRLI